MLARCVPKTSGHSTAMTNEQAKDNVSATNRCITSTKDDNRKMFEYVRNTLKNSKVNGMTRISVRVASPSVKRVSANKNRVI